MASDMNLRCHMIAIQVNPPAVLSVFAALPSGFAEGSNTVDLLNNPCNIGSSVNGKSISNRKDSSRCQIVTPVRLPFF